MKFSIMLISLVATFVLLVQKGNCGIYPEQDAAKIDIASVQNTGTKLNKKLKTAVEDKVGVGQSFNILFAKLSLSQAKEKRAEISAKTKEIDKFDPESDNGLKRMRETQIDRLDEIVDLEKILKRQEAALARALKDDKVTETEKDSIGKEREAIEDELQDLGKQLVNEADAITDDLDYPTLDAAEEAKVGKLRSKLREIKIDTAETMLQFCHNKRSMTNNLEKQDKFVECEREFGDTVKDEIEKEMRAKKTESVGASDKEKAKIKQDQQKLLIKQKATLSKLQKTLQAESAIASKKIESTSDETLKTKMQNKRKEAEAKIKEIDMERDVAEIALLSNVIQNGDPASERKAAAKMENMNKAIKVKTSEVIKAKEARANAETKKFEETIASNNPDVNQVLKAAESKHELAEAKMVYLKDAVREREVLQRKLELETDQVATEQILEKLRLNKVDIDKNKQKVQVEMTSLSTITDSACKLGDTASDTCQEAMEWEGEMTDDMSGVDMELMNVYDNEKGIIKKRLKNTNDENFKKTLNQDLNEVEMKGTDAGLAMVETLQQNRARMQKRLESAPEALKSKIIADQNAQIKKLESANGAVGNAIEKNLADAKDRMSSMSEADKAKTEKFASEMETMKSHTLKEKTKFAKMTQDIRKENRNKAETMWKEGKSRTGEKFEDLHTKAKDMANKGDAQMAGMMQKVNSFQSSRDNIMKTAGEKGAEAMNSAKQAAADGVEQGKTLGAEAAQKVKDAGSGAVEGAKQAGADGVEKARSMGDKAVQKIQDMGSGVIDKAKQMGGDALNKMSEAGGNAMQGARDAIQ